MRLARTAVEAAGPALAALGVRLLGHTLRLAHDEAPVEHLLAARTPVIFTAWHSRILLLPWAYPDLRARVLTSRSRDGDVLARLLLQFGLEAVRGSSSRGGTAALRGLLDTLKAGLSVMVVPDGPRGPREQVKPGIAVLARLSGAPVVPIAAGASREWQLRSWDGFRIPQPFARFMVRMGAPIAPPAGRDGEEAVRAAVERALAELTARVDAEARA